MADVKVMPDDIGEGIVIPSGSGEMPVDFDPSNVPMPSLEEIMKMIDGMEGMSDEERAEFKASLLNPQGQQHGGSASGNYMVFLLMISIIILVFVFFGYKLYKSLTEKERKREEKLKAKQAKKKK